MPAPAPEARDENGRFVTSSAQLHAGQSVRVQWGAGWFDARIVSVSGSGAVVHYDGWSDLSDEDVPRDRIRLR